MTRDTDLSQVTGHCLVPEPSSVVIGSGAHTFRQTVTVLLSSQAGRETWVIARQLEAAVSRRGLSVSILPRSRQTSESGCIVLAVAEKDEDIFSCAAGRPFSATGVSQDEAYRLTIEPDRVLVVGATSAGLVQGVRTLIQLLITSDSLPCMTIEDVPALPWRGVMLDISRGKVPTLTTLKHVVDVIASFKLNMLQLYMEDTFSFHNHPKIGAGWGAMIPEDIVSLDEYCRDRCIELIPCLQSLGHHRRLLSIQEYAHLAHSPEDWTLTPGEGTWSLLEELFDDLLPCFTSRYVNICCDEPYDLTHTSAQTHEAAVGYASSNEPTATLQLGDGDNRGISLYLTHVQRLHEALRVRGRTTMLWDDIFQQAPNMLPEMPSDTIFLSWFYEAAETYPQTDTIRRAARRSIVCPGTSTWNTISPRLDNARTNIRGFVRSGVATGSIGVLTTDWGDCGHPNFLGSSWYGYAYGGSEGWSPGQLSDDEFDNRFSRLFFGQMDAHGAIEGLRLMSAACTLPSINKMNGSCTRAMFFRNPLTDDEASLAPDNSIHQMHDLGKRALDALTPLHGMDAARTLTLTEMRFAARQIVHAARKTRAGRRLATIPDDDSKGRRELHAEFLALKRELHELRWDYQCLWLARNKPEGIWLTLDHFDTAAGVLDRWRDAVAPRYSHGQ